MEMAYFDKAAGYLPDVFFSRPPDAGVLLGSGWGESLVADETIVRIPYSDIPGLGATSVSGHAGELVLFVRGGKRVVAWCGRRHYYEGAGWECVVLPVELLRRMCDPRLTHRFASPDEVVRFLEEWRIIEARRFRTFLVWFAVVMTLAVAAVVALGVRMIGGNAPSSADVLEKSAQDDSPESEFSIPNAVD